VPAPMWGWAKSKANTSSAPVEEEKEEMAGPPCAIGEEEEEDDEPEEEEEDESDHREDSAELGEEDAGLVSQRCLGPYVMQRLPGIYTCGGSLLGLVPSARRTSLSSPSNCLRPTTTM